MFPIFSCSINVTVTSQNGIPFFHMKRHIKQIISASAKSHFSAVYCVEVVENVY